MLPVSSARSRRSAEHRERTSRAGQFLSRKAAQKPLTSCAFLLVAFSLIYICCVLVSSFRSHGRPVHTPGVNNLEVRRSGHVRTPDPDSLQKEQGKQQVLEVQQPTLPEPPTLLQRLQAPLKKKGDAERHPKPDRVRANGLEYEICRASAYSVPNYGPLLILERGASTACAAYLYAAPFARTTPLLPVLPSQSDPWPLPPQARQLPPHQSLPVLSEDSARVDTSDPVSTGSLPDRSVSHHFGGPVLSPSELGRHKPPSPPSHDPVDPEENDLADASGGTDTTAQHDADSTQANGNDKDHADEDQHKPEDDPNEDPPVERDTGGAVDEDSEETPPDEDATTTEVDSQRRLLEEQLHEQPSLLRPARQLVSNKAQPNAKDLARSLSDSDEATGVLAAAIMLAAEEMQRASADLEPLPTMHTPPATASLPEDIGRWSHVQLDRAVKLQAAWQSGNTSALAFPHTLALLNHPARGALVAQFSSAASCLLQRLGGPAPASPAGHVSPEQARASVVSWPQYLSYESAESMPTGRETSMPGALMRGIYVAHANGSVILELFDPRAPLDSQEVQDALPELYRIELRTGDLVVLPPWILTSILAVPPMEQEVKVGNREPHSMYQLVKRAHERSKQLGFDSSVSFDHFPQPPRSTHAAILHLTLPGDPSLSAGSILPMHMGTLKPPPLSQLEHDARRTLLGQDSDSQGSGSKDIPDEDTVVDDDPDNGDADDDDLAGVDIVQEQGTHPDKPDPNAGSEGDSQEDPPDADADADVEWADRERSIQPPDRNSDSSVPLHRPSTPNSLHAPGVGRKAPGEDSAETLRAPGYDAQGQNKQDIRTGLHTPVEIASGGSVPGHPDASMGGAAGESGGHEATCPNVDRIWFSFGSPVTVYNLPEVDPQLDLHALRSLALAAFAAFRNCLPNKGEEFDRESPGSLGDEMFDWQTKWPDPGSTPCDGGQPGPVGREIEKQWRTAYTAYLDSEAHTRMLQAVSTSVVSMLKRMGKDDLAEDEDPGIFSWLTVHDESMSYHGRHYHRNQAITAVLYLELPHESAPLEFSNPIEGPDSQPNGRTVFVPTIGDFVLFPSYLGHTVPMRLLRDKQQPRISIAFNIWLAGPGLDRFAEGVSEEERDDVGKHQYFAVSDVTMDRHFMPREGLDLSIERDTDIE